MLKETFLDNSSRFVLSFYNFFKKYGKIKLLIINIITKNTKKIKNTLPYPIFG